MSLRIGSFGTNFEALSAQLAAEEAAQVQEAVENVVAATQNSAADVNVQRGDGTVLPSFSSDVNSVIQMRALNDLVPSELPVDTLTEEILPENIFQTELPLETLTNDILPRDFFPKNFPINFPSFKSPLFVQGAGDANEVDMNDISQGGTGDCWMMGPLAELAAKDPEAIRRMIKDNGDGTYTVTFKERVYVPGAGHIVVDKPVTVNGDLYPDLYLPHLGRFSPHANPGDANSLGRGEIWPMIIEKAYSQYKGNYSGLLLGGNPGEFMEALTGQPAKSYNGMKLSQVGGISYDDLRNEFDSGKNVVFCTQQNLGGALGLVDNHCYAVRRIYIDENGRKMVELYNPWGTNQPQAIPYEEASSYFSSIIMN